jgi:hypothetical protein
VIAKSFLEGRINQSGIFMVGEVKKLVSGTGIQAKADLDTSKNPLLNIVGDVLIASAKVARATLTLGKDCLRVRLCVGNKDVGVDANIIMKYAGSNWSLCIKGRGYVDVWPFGRRSVALPTVFVNVGTGNYGASFLAGIGVCGNIPGGDIHLSSNVSNCAGAGSACNDCN